MSKVVASGAILALAPMEGVTDPVVRELVSALGGLDYCVTEFIRVASESPSEKVFLRDCPELETDGRTGPGVPVHVQLLGGDPGRMADAGARAASLGALVVDLNFGCPAPTVNRHDGGATLLKTPCRVEDVTRAVRAAVPAHLPVSAKIRLGWDNADSVVELALAAQAGGASWLTIHGRTRAQGYKPPADWRAIGRAREALHVPVVANGDINSPEELSRCRDESGCERFMLGRGAIARPELFRVLRGLDEGYWPAERRVALLAAFAARSRARFPGREREGGILGRMKQWCRAMAPADTAVGALWERLRRLDVLDEALALVAAFREASRESLLESEGCTG